jgi:hypothetical protein
VIQDWYDEIIAAMEGGMPREGTARAQLEFYRHAPAAVLIHGTGLCALVLSEGAPRGRGSTRCSCRCNGATRRR